MAKKDIILIGGGGHCKACIDVIELENKYHVKGIVDVPEKINTTVLGYPIIAQDDQIIDLSKRYSNFLITIGHLGNTDLRTKVYNLLHSLEVTLPTIISPIAHISKHAKIGAGTIVMHHAIINADARIGNNCIINNKALIEHEAIIGDHCHISTGAIVNGGVKVGQHCFYGSGAISKQGIHIPNYSFIKANSIIK